MPTHVFYQLDVFTDTPLAGNPLAVFPDAEALDAATMQRLAREMNLSETTFVLPSERATHRVRFFTPTAEIPLAGHPTIGTWWLLAELGRLREGPTIDVTQETGAGVLPVRIAMGNGRPARVTMTQPRPTFGPTVTDTAPLAAALGGRPSVLAPTPAPEVVATAMPQLMIPIASIDGLRGLPVGGKSDRLATLLRTLDTDCAMCFVIESGSSPVTVHCRMFAPGFGVPEDPATGSAAGALGCYLVRHDLVTPVDGSVEIRCLQGAEIDRPSRMDVSVRTDRHDTITDVEVGGNAVTIIRGEVTL